MYPSSHHLLVSFPLPTSVSSKCTHSLCSDPGLEERTPALEIKAPGGCSGLDRTGAGGGVVQVKSIQAEPAQEGGCKRDRDLEPEVTLRGSRLQV